MVGPVLRVTGLLNAPPSATHLNQYKGVFLSWEEIETQLVQSHDHSVLAVEPARSFTWHHPDALIASQLRKAYESR